MIMICAFSDYYQGDTLEVFKREDLKVMKTMRALNVDSLKIHHPFLLHLYIKVLNESWLTQEKWHKPILSTSVSLWSFSPNKETQLNSEQLPSLIFISPGREHCSLCLCPQLDSTPWVCKLIKKLGETISLTRWRAIVSWWCAWYSMGLHYDYNPPPPFFFNTHTHILAWEPGSHQDLPPCPFFFSTGAKRNMVRMCIKL